MAAGWRRSNGISTADVQHRVKVSPFSAAIMSSLMIAIAGKTGQSMSTQRSIAMIASVVDIGERRRRRRLQALPGVLFAKFGFHNE